MKNIIYLKKYFKFSKIHLFTIVFFLILSSVIGIIIPLYLKKVLDKSLDTQFIIYSGGVILFLFVLQMIFKSISTYALGVITEKNILSLRLTLWDKILKLPFNFFKKNNTGDIINILFYDIETVTTFFTNVLPNIVPLFMTTILSIIIITILDFKITLLAVALLLTSILFIAPLSNKTQELTSTFQKNNSELYDMFASSTSFIHLIKAYNGYDYEKESALKKANNMYKNQLSILRVQTIINPIISLIVIITMIIVIIYCIYRVNQGSLTISTILVILLYLFQLSSPLIEISSIIMIMSKANVSSISIINLLNTIDEFQDYNEVNLEFNNNVNCLKIDNLDFKFNKEKEIFKNLNLEVSLNAPLGIVGKIGTGKSTLFNLIERLELPISGKILLNGMDISNINLKEYRNLISYVSQDSYIINDTIRKNIEYGHSNQITESFLKKYKIFDFILDLPQQIDTNIGNKGYPLSGGQKQLICLARAICKDSPIILLDEISSNLDGISEEKLKQILFDLQLNKILLVVSHRFSTIQNFENILFLSDNEYYLGNHKYLFNTVPEYKKMYLNQEMKHL